MGKHYIAMSGSVGCLPDYCDVFPKQEDAISVLTSVHELSAAQKKVLRRDGIISLTVGADYAQVQECSCGFPQLHSEHPLDLEEYGNA